MVCFAISFLLRILWFFAQKKMLCIRDEVGFLVVPATLGGNDWSGMIDVAGYYGFGYSVIFTPLYMLTRNPFVLYWSMMVIGAIILAIASCVIYKISVSYMDIPQVPAVCFATAIVYLADAQMRYLDNEPMITLVIWAMILVFMKLFHEENRAKQYVLSFVMAALMLYALIIHNRLLVAVVCMVIAIVLCFVIFKKLIIPVPIIAGAGVVAAIIEKLFIPYMENNYWDAASRDGVVNSVGTTTTGMFAALSSLSDIGFINAVFRLIVGNLFASSFYSCGIFIFALFFLISQLIRLVKDRTNDLGSDRTDDNLVLMDIFMWPAFAITMAGMIMLWASGVKHGLEQGAGVYEYGYKAFYYLRYYAVYLSLIIYAALVRLYHRRQYFDKYLTGRYIIVILVVYTAFQKLIVPYLIGTYNGLFAFASYGLYSADQEVTESGLYIWIHILSVAIALLALKLVKSGTPRNIVLLSLILLLFNYQRGWYNSAVITDSYSDLGDGGYRTFRYLETEKEFDKSIYVVSTNTHRMAAYQLHLVDYKIIPTEEFPVDLEQGFVVTKNSAQKSLRESEGFTMYKMDDNEYLWITGYEFSDALYGFLGMQGGR